MEIVFNFAISYNLGDCMCYSIQLATFDDLQAIHAIYADSRMFMQENGNKTQWTNGYPSDALLREDIDNHFLYVCLEGDELVGVFALCGHEPTYDVIHHGQWQNNASYVTIHRIASKKHSRGIASYCMQYVQSLNQNVRIDTHRDNIPMQKLILKTGYLYCGIIYLENGEERLAYHFAR